MAYQRERKDGAAAPVVYWAQIWRPDKGQHGETLTSPSFATQLDLSAWLRQHVRAGDDVFPYRREQPGGGFRNVVLRDDGPRSPEGAAHVASLLAGLAASKGVEPKPKR